MDRQLIGPLAVVALVLLAGCAGVAETGQTDASNDSVVEPDRTIEVASTGQATAEPDRATIRISVEATGSDPKAVRDQLAADDEELLTALRDWGLEDDQIRTVRYDVRETRESRTSEDTEQYVGQHMYALELDDVEAVGDVIDVSISNGAARVDSVRFGLSEEREAEVREQALEDAMTSADADAAVLADNAGLEVVGVYSVSTADTRTIRAEYVTATQERGDAATSVEPGDVSVEVRVRVVYNAVKTGS